MSLDDSLSDIAQSAARAVGPRLVDAFAGPIEVEYKADFHDPVTVHDRWSEATIREILFSKTPQSIVLGEEEGALINSSGHAARRGPDTVMWLVDPIDGTSNFAAGLERWCVSIGAVVGDRMVAGVIYHPLTDTMYYTDSTGAFKNGSRIAVSTLALNKAVIATDFPSAQAAERDGAWDAYHSVLASAKSMRRHGSTALDLAGVADGTFGGTFGAAHPWDVAAGIALIEKAGGTYVGVEDSGAIQTQRTWETAAYAASGNPQTLIHLEDAMNRVNTTALIANYFE